NLHLNVDEQTVLEILQLKIKFEGKFSMKQIYKMHNLPSGRRLFLPRVMIAHDSGVINVSHFVDFTQCLGQLVLTDSNLHPLDGVFLLVERVLRLENNAEGSLPEMTSGLEFCQKSANEVVAHGLIRNLSRGGEERTQLFIQSGQHREI
ncbi:hypothetical protein PFISCL1PPCAC_7525, partial [Pristionchus fissidentatus]